MAELTMPKMGFDMEEGTIVRWIKKVGDDVKKGEPIAEIETDKVTIEIEAFASGTLQKIVTEEGSVVPVGATIAILGDGDDASAEDTAPASAPAALIPHPPLKRQQGKLAKVVRRLRLPLRKPRRHPTRAVNHKQATAQMFLLNRKPKDRLPKLPAGRQHRLRANQESR